MNDYSCYNAVFVDGLRCETPFSYLHWLKLLQRKAAPMQTYKWCLRQDLLKVDKQDLIIVNEPNGLDLGKVTATVGIMLQARMDYTFQLFVDECLERFKNFVENVARKTSSRVHSLLRSEETDNLFIDEICRDVKHLSHTCIG